VPSLCLAFFVFVKNTDVEYNRETLFQASGDEAAGLFHSGNVSFQLLSKLPPEQFSMVKHLTTMAVRNQSLADVLL
jgi:hypothetical protein